MEEEKTEKAPRRGRPKKEGVRQTPDKEPLPPDWAQRSKSWQEFYRVLKRQLDDDSLNH